MFVYKRKCDRLWENPAKVARQNSEKKGKSKKKKKLIKDATFYPSQSAKIYSEVPFPFCLIPALCR
jgi:hypothetical protein